MKNYIIVAAIFIVAGIQYQLGIHGVEWGMTSAFMLPFLLMIIKYGLDFYKKIIRLDKDGNPEVDDIFILIILSICLDVATYYVGLHSPYSK